MSRFQLGIQYDRGDGSPGFIPVESADVDGSTITNEQVATVANSQGIDRATKARHADGIITLQPGRQPSHARPPVLRRDTASQATTNSGPPKPLGRPGYDLPSQQQATTANQSQAAGKPKPLGRPTF